MVAVDNFATAADMEQRTQGAISAATHPRLEAELAAATALIRRACGWYVAPIDTATFRHSGRFVRDIWLPAMEIDSIESATVDGYVVSVDAIEFDRDTGWTNLHGRVWEIVYVAGFETVPDELVSLTLQMAARALGSPLGITREQIGQHSVTFAEGGVSLLDAEEATLTPYILGALP